MKASMSESRFAVHFGGPDLPAGSLRNLLSQRVAASPPGSTIDWATYYFRDRELARDLIAASDRGVQVRLLLEGKPRIARANEQVLAALTTHDALRTGLRVVQMPGYPSPPGLAWKPQFHTKIYCFSHPYPAALVGSFNPSGDSNEYDPGVVAKIGDHNIAHNALVEVRDEAIVGFLVDHLQALHRVPDARLRRTQSNLPFERDFGDTQVYLWPRRGQHPIERLLEGYGGNCRVRIAASHIRNPWSVNCLARLARRGARVEIAAEHSARRVPRRMERRLTAAGAAFTRFGATENVPMHLKFVLAESTVGRQAIFGSYNWTLPSYWLNHEIAMATRDEHVFESLERRWCALQEAEGASTA
ncbi:MAG: phospholipase D-like domain-containing protein [Steroidobacteraceae bacterium]